MGGYREQIVGKPALYIVSFLLSCTCRPAYLLRLGTFQTGYSHVPIHR